ncbi:MAG: alpha/beta hydrolase-fold protein [Acidobacteriaceae bacterium]|nr:alpha/beta hydrolase-fold protein [Acidobacteriaceae bacterium]
MNREYHRWWSKDLSREMELLVFGHDGVPVVVFPVAGGRFYDFEDRGMVKALGEKLEHGRLQLFCLDEGEVEGWWSQELAPELRPRAEVRYERYVLEDVVPLIRSKNRRPRLSTAGCAAGGYRAVNLALKHPQLFSSALSMSGIFDLKQAGLLGGHYEDASYFNLPLDYLPGAREQAYLEQLRRSSFVLAAGARDAVRKENEALAGVMRSKGIPVRLDLWGEQAESGWPWWQRMVQIYL